MAKEQQKPATLWSRRDTLIRSGWAALLSAIGVATAGTVRLLFPRVHFTPPSKIVLGAPDQFAVGQVSTKWKKSHNVVVVRTEDGVFALRLVCTHLGCIPSWKPAERKFKCPCHGSGFHRDGVNFEGPAPRALERLKIFQDEEGRLVVDTAVRLFLERGDWEKAEALFPHPSGGKHG